jgi:hypothetical protein
MRTGVTVYLSPTDPQAPALKRGVFKGVVDLQAAINRFVADHNQQPSPSSGPPIQTRSSPPPIVGIKCWIQSTR